MAGLKKIILKNATQMSLHERFTYLRSQPSRSEDTVQSVRAGLALQHQASARNRRLAAQMERRPAVMAALKIKQKSLRQRLGTSRPSVTERLSLNSRPLAQRVAQSAPLRSQSLSRSPRGSGARARLSIGVRGRVFRPQTQFSPLRQPRNIVTGGRFRASGTLSRSQSLGNLTRSQSTGNLNVAGRFQNQIQNRSYQGQTQFPKSRGIQSRPQRGVGRGSQGFNGQRVFRGGRGAGAVRGQFQQQRGGQRGGRGGNFRRGSGGVGAGLTGGRGRGRGGRGRGGRGRNPPPPSKEELDKQLDQYMASTKSTLDKELDSYMNQGE